MRPLGVDELGGDVAGPVDVDDPALAAVGAEHGQAAAGVLDGLDVDAGPGAGEGAEQLADQGVALELTDAGDHRQARVQVEGERVATCFDDQPLEPHARRSTRIEPRLSRCLRALGGPRGRPLASAVRPRTAYCRLRQRFAPLAQSAEHSHGKAGVVGSIPTGGSQASKHRGGVAQMVRALGS